MFYSYWYIFLFFSASTKSTSTNNDVHKSRAYYFSTQGNDKNDGSKHHPLKTINYLNTLHLQGGDSVLLKGGETFDGTLYLNGAFPGSHENPVVVSSYANGRAVINAGNLSAVSFNNISYARLTNLICKGSGRKGGNSKAGIDIMNSQNISLDNIDVSGFQKSGIQLYSCKNVTLNKVYAHDNGAAGIGVEGDFSNKVTTVNIRILNCRAENNPGDPTNLTNHSGNGIVAGHCTNVLIDHCSATNNGWDMPRIGNGPVGIWCYEADSVVIQHCLAYRNKTSIGGADGGGFDLDGGVTNSIVQYCLSYENQGSGYCMFQYWGASPWHHNVIRFNISENDGLVSDSRAGAYVWNSSEDATQFHDCDFYNNTIYNTKQAALNFSVTSKRNDFRFFNNIFVAKDSLVRGNRADDLFIGNNWWSIENKFNVDGSSDFTTWAAANHVEELNGVQKGINEKPSFKNAGNITITNPSFFEKFDYYKLTRPIRSAIDLRAVFTIHTGNVDFNGLPVARDVPGACTHQ